MKMYDLQFYIFLSKEAANIAFISLQVICCQNIHILLSKLLGAPLEYVGTNTKFNFPCILLQLEALPFNHSNSLIPKDLHWNICLFLKNIPKKIILKLFPSLLLKYFHEKNNTCFFVWHFHEDIWQMTVGFLVPDCRGAPSFHFWTCTYL